MIAELRVAFALYADHGAVENIVSLSSLLVLYFIYLKLFKLSLAGGGVDLLLTSTWPFGVDKLVCVKKII